jgi:hypothetical protein
MGGDTEVGAGAGVAIRAADILVNCAANFPETKPGKTNGRRDSSLDTNPKAPLCVGGGATSREAGAA